MTRNKYSSSFQKFYRPNSAVSYHHSRIYQYNPQSYYPHYHRHHHLHHAPAYYHYQPYTQPYYYAHNRGKLASWLGAIKFNSELQTTTEKITTTDSIKRKKKDFNVSMTSSKSIVSQSRSVTMSTTSVVTSISSTISVKQLSTTTSSSMTTNSTLGDLPDLTTEAVFLVYPAVDDTGIDDGLTETSPPETTSAMTTLKPLSLTYRYRENKNIFGLLSQLNQSVSSLCKYSRVKRMCTMRNILS